MKNKENPIRFINKVEELHEFFTGEEIKLPGTTLGRLASKILESDQIQTYQELIEWAKKEKIPTPEDCLCEDCLPARNKNGTLEMLISYLKGRIEEVKKDEIHKTN